MSTFFEGVVVAVGRGRARDVVEKIETSARLAIEALNESVSVVFATNARSEGAFANEIRKVGGHLSESLGAALVVLFNDQSGERCSEFFQDGRCVDRFGDEDELYVPLDEGGEPILSATRLRVGELGAGEYETVVNAVQLGMRRLAVGDLWGEILRLAGEN